MIRDHNRKRRHNDWTQNGNGQSRYSNNDINFSGGGYNRGAGFGIDMGYSDNGLGYGGQDNLGYRPSGQGYGRDLTYGGNNGAFGGMDDFSTASIGINSNQQLSYPESQVVQYNCNELRETHIGKIVRVVGRLSNFRNNKFVELRDHVGVVQGLVTQKRPKIMAELLKIPLDTQVAIVGEVKLRPNCNPSIPTGKIEIHIEQVINTRQTADPSDRFPYSNYPLQGFTPIAQSKRQQHRLFSTSSAKVSREITPTEAGKTESKAIHKYFEKRKTTCGELRAKDVDKRVVLVGWLENKKHGRFLQLRDGYGATQIVVGDIEDCKEKVAAMTDDSIILVKGKVKLRPQNNQNVKKDTGEIEVVVEDMRILDPDAPYLSPELLDVVNATKATGATDEGGEKLSAAVNKYANRTHTCGELTEAHVGQDVTLCGWLEFQRMKKFLVLRDGYGCTQVVVPTEDQAEQLKSVGVEMNLPSPDLDGIPYESIIKVTGTVSARPAGMVNEKMGTGYIEVYMKTFEVLNAAKKSLPIELRDHNRSGEIKRLEHRYIDLRCATMQKNLRTRSQVCMRMREYLINRCGFVEIETPTLFRRTPGGAQEFVVPSRKRGHFYSLVQSPQQFKQMLMAGAFDRYFQIARCYRDEATRPDRQPEFTQLDIEMSFTDRDQIMSLIETVLVKSWPEWEGCLSTPFRHMTYEQAMELYGSDKPDTRYDMLLKNVTTLLKLNEELASKYKNFGAYALVVTSPKCEVPQTMMGTMKKVAQQSAAKFVFSKVSSTSVMDWVRSSIKKLLSEVVTKSLAADLHLNVEDRLLLAYGEKEDAQKLLGKIREEFIKAELLEKTEAGNKGHHFLWVTDFPMFALDPATGTLETVHHPFTAPHPDDAHFLNEVADISTATSEQLANLQKIRSLAYDLVLDGQEVGGGSIRIHDADLQKKVLDNILKLDYHDLQHLIDALQSGCPPHGGIALGLDRLIAIICHTKSIRDVIAFPKSLDGKDVLSKAPVPITQEEKLRYHLEILDEEREKELKAMLANRVEDEAIDQEAMDVENGTIDVKASAN